MNKSPLVTVLLAVLAISALASVTLCYMYVTRSRDLRALQMSVAGIEGNRRLAQAVATDALEYSKTHPAIQPLLDAAGVKLVKPGTPAPAPAPTNKPAAK